MQWYDAQARVVIEPNTRVAKAKGASHMYSLLTGISRAELFKRQLPVFLIALVIAELLYKFHSFVLECGAFLATWYALDAASNLLFARRGKDERPQTP
jgi:hypothetical protein